jgi:hypothetical protein
VLDSHLILFEGENTMVVGWQLTQCFRHVRVEQRKKIIRSAMV